MKRNTASIPAPGRTAAYINELKTLPNKSKTQFATNGIYTYKVSRQQGTPADKTVNLDIPPPSQRRCFAPKSEREPILVTIEELRESAKEMHSINPEDY